MNISPSIILVIAVSFIGILVTLFVLALFALQINDFIQFFKNFKKNSTTKKEGLTNSILLKEGGITSPMANKKAVREKDHQTIFEVTGKGFIITIIVFIVFGKYMEHAGESRVYEEIEYFVSDCYEAELECLRNAIEESKNEGIPGGGYDDTAY